MKVALDTNILAYAEGTNGAAMRDKTLDLIERLPQRLSYSPFRRGANCSMYSSGRQSVAQRAREQLS